MPKQSATQSKVFALSSIVSAVLPGLLFLSQGDVFQASPWLAFVLLVAWPILLLWGHLALKPEASLGDCVLFTMTDLLATYFLVAAALMLQPGLLETLSGGHSTMSSGPWPMAAAVLFGLSGAAVLLGGVWTRR